MNKVIQRKNLWREMKLQTHVHHQPQANTNITNMNQKTQVVAKPTKSPETVYDIVEHLVKNENDSVRVSLEFLKALKTNLTDQNVIGTVDILIRHFEEKESTLRGNEEHIRKVIKDSRELMQEKRGRDIEVESVRGSICQFQKQIQQLDATVKELRKKEEELHFIEKHLNKELEVNANEVLNGLFEIVLTEPEKNSVTRSHLPQSQQTEVDAQKEEPRELRLRVPQDICIEKVTPAEGSIGSQEGVVSQEIRKAPEYVFPRSVVKTTQGTVIGEYFYDPALTGNKRHYIYNSGFFMKQLTRLASMLENGFDQRCHTEGVQIIQDAYKRISENSSMHFEISTNEILNLNVLKELWQKIVRKEYADIHEVCNKLEAKIRTLGKNYFIMQKEQMVQYLEKVNTEK